MEATLRHLCDYNRHGLTYGGDVCIRFSTWYIGDEKNSSDYIGDGNVAIEGWEPYFEEDIKGILTNAEFFEYLKQYTDLYLQHYPTEESVIENYLNIIKARLNV